VAANRTNVLHEAELQASWRLQRLGRELRLARMTAGASQQAIADRLGISRPVISRIERGKLPHLSVHALHRFAAVVGLRAAVNLYPGGRHVVDAPQLALLNDLRQRLGLAFQWQLEVPVAIASDLRAADALLTRGDLTISVEAITRLSDVQAQLRAAQLKRRDIGATRLLLVIRGSNANRRAIRVAEPVLRAHLRTGTRSILSDLAAGRDPGADCLVVL
jgi:transcriptional regulator with XRE-family HTH domain